MLSDFARTVVGRFVDANCLVSEVEVVHGKRQQFPGPHPCAPRYREQSFERFLCSRDDVGRLRAGKERDWHLACSRSELQIGEPDLLYFHVGSVVNL